MTEFESNEIKRLQEENHMLETQLLNIITNNTKLTAENTMLREFIVGIGAKIKETVREEISFDRKPWSKTAESFATRTYQHYTIDRFQFIVENPSPTIVATWEDLMKNGVLDTLDRETNKAFFKLDLSKLNESDYFYLACEARRLIK